MSESRRREAEAGGGRRWRAEKKAGDGRIRRNGVVVDERDRDRVREAEIAKRPPKST